MITKKGGSKKVLNEEPKPKKTERVKMFSEAFEEDLKELIDSRIEENAKKKISLEDLNEIARLLVGDIDRLISEKIKLHLKLLAEKLIDQVK